jgi:DNA ligase D-like protein (predicted ligase)
MTERAKSLAVSTSLLSLAFQSPVSVRYAVLPMPSTKTPAKFIDPMDCLPVAKLPEGAQWVWELKWDGYRAVAVKDSTVKLYSRNHKSLDKKFPYISEALTELPNETVVDGEIVALDDQGRPSFNLLQNFVSGAARIRYFLFDVVLYKGRNVTRLPLSERRKLLVSLQITNPRIKISDVVEADSADLLRSAREQHLEGIVGKRKDSLYEPGKRSGAWIKYRLNLGQEFVIGGFTPGPHGLDAVIVGYYRGKDLMYVARTRNGFVPSSRRRVFEKLKPQIVQKCPFVNLPETRKARWGEALTAEKMKKCVWVRPDVVAQIEFLEWTGADHLRHSKFIGLRHDKDPNKVTKES